jgi:hypothetical protein
VAPLFFWGVEARSLHLLGGLRLARFQLGEVGVGFARMQRMLPGSGVVLCKSGLAAAIAAPGSIGWPQRRE